MTERTTVAQAAAENMYDGRPFGHAHDDLVRLLAKHREGDELWYFAPPDPGVFQVWGVAPVRANVVVSTVITAVD